MTSLTCTMRPPLPLRLCRCRSGVSPDRLWCLYCVVAVIAAAFCRLLSSQPAFPPHCFLCLRSGDARIPRTTRVAACCPLSQYCQQRQQGWHRADKFRRILGGYAKSYCFFEISAATAHPPHLLHCIAAASCTSSSRFRSPQLLDRQIRTRTLGWSSPRKSLLGPARRGDLSAGCTAVIFRPLLGGQTCRFGGEGAAWKEGRPCRGSATMPTA